MDSAQEKGEGKKGGGVRGKGRGEKPAEGAGIKGREKKR